MQHMSSCHNAVQRVTDFDREAGIGKTACAAAAAMHKCALPAGNEHIAAHATIECFAEGRL